MLKRFILLLLLIVMPFQMAWAAPSAYCQHEHEQGAAASHFGHHSHQHRDGGKFQGKVPGSVDDDCAYCHLGGMILPPALQPVFVSPLSSIEFSSFLKTMSSVPASEPERPKWTLAA